MSKKEDFFETPSEQSIIKAKIVASYFTAWARVMRDNWNTTIPIGYIDLFCGPGTYQDGTKSVPIMLIEKTLSDPNLLKRMFFVFNDMNAESILSLQSEINKIPGINLINSRIQYSTNIVDSDFSKRLGIATNIPALSFVDPFGYKGLSLDLINKLIANNGSDCIFFFNYNRINMALSSNTKFDEYLVGLFGNEMTMQLKDELSILSPRAREPVILNALVKALCEGGAKYVLPFKFYSTEMVRTSHFIIFVSKHKAGYRIMKSIMYSNSKKDSDGVASFSFEDSFNFGEGFEQLTLFSKPLDNLCDSLIAKNQGQSIMVKKLCDEVMLDTTSHYVVDNVKEALRRLEKQGKVMVKGRKKNIQNGKATMPDGATVTFSS